MDTIRITPSSANKKEESLQNAKNGENEDDDDDYLEEDVIDLRSFSPIGSLFIVDLIHLPHQAKEIKGWTVQQGLFLLFECIKSLSKI